MPNKFVKSSRGQSKSKSQSQSKSQNQNQSQSKSQNQNQTGGTGEPIKIDEATLRQAGEMAQQLLNKAVAPQSGGSALQGSEFSAAPSAADPTAAGLKTAMVGGAVAGAVVGAEAYSSLKGSELVGGRKRRRGRGRGRQSQSQSQSKSQSQSQSQKGGMVPGLLSAVETALVPLGLYLGQKALQSRRSGSRSLGKSFSFRNASRRTRRRR